MKNKIKKIIDNINVMLVMNILIVISALGFTYSLIIGTINSININTSAIPINANITYDAGSNSDVIINNGNMLPIDDSLVTGPDVTDVRVMKAKFNLSGSITNPENTIYDIALHDIDMDCQLKTPDLKWRLYKENTLLSSGSFSETFDTMPNNRMVLTNTQEDLTSDTVSYTFLLWISESCTGDITQCDSSYDQTIYLNRNFKAVIKAELSTKTKKVNTRITSSEESCEYTSTSIPICNSLTYNGSAQTLVNSGTNYSLSNAIGTNAGTYAVIAKLNDGYKWNDGSTNDKVITCGINKANATITTLDQTITYGNSLSNSVSNITSANLISGDKIDSISLNSSIYDVGTGFISSSKPKIVNSRGNDVTSNYFVNYNNTGVVTINCSNISEEPTASNLMYNGSKQTGVSGGSYVDITGDVFATSIGNYTAIATPQKNYCWRDNTTTSKEIAWKIMSTDEVLTVSSDNVTLKHPSSITLNYSYAGDGNLSCTPTNSTIATCSLDVNNNSIVINSVSAGNTTVTLAATSGTSFGAVSTVINVNVEYKQYVINLNNQGANISGSTTLYGRYSDGIYLDSGYVNKMTTNTNPITVPTRTGYSFGGYYSGANGTGTQMINSNGYITSNLTNTIYSENATLYASWTPKVYTINYSCGTGSGTVPASQSVTYNSNFTIATNTCSKEGYTFSGWSDPTGDTSWTGLTGVWKYDNGQFGISNNTLLLTAQWVADKYTVTTKYVYKYQNTENKVYSSISAEVDSGDSYTPIELDGGIDGYYLNTTYNYYIDSSLIGTGSVGTSSFTVTDNITVEVYYYPNQYTISYDSNGGGTAPISHTKYHATPTTLSDAVLEREGYEFLGWSTSSDATSATYVAGDSYTVNSDVTLYAVWRDATPPSITVSGCSGQKIEIAYCSINYSDGESGIDPSTLSYKKHSSGTYKSFGISNDSYYKDSWAAERHLSYTSSSGSFSVYYKVCDYAGNCSEVEQYIQLRWCPSGYTYYTVGPNGNGCARTYDYGEACNSNEVDRSESSGGYCYIKGYYSY